MGLIPSEGKEKREHFFLTFGEMVACTKLDTSALLILGKNYYSHYIPIVHIFPTESI
jgi:hypothetical protein